jgi:hypothetical protein
MYDFVQFVGSPAHKIINMRTMSLKIIPAMKLSVLIPPGLSNDLGIFDDWKPDDH